MGRFKVRTCYRFELVQKPETISYVDKREKKSEAKAELILDVDILFIFPSRFD